MEDSQIIDLYWTRSEYAISATAEKYGRYCHYIAFHILHSYEDSEECVNETYLQAWKAIPPHRPANLSAFLGKITRNLALNKRRLLTAQKRGLGQIPLILDELQECLPASDKTGPTIDRIALTEVLNRFLSSLPKRKRQIFMRRYWYGSSVKEIASDFSLRESAVKMSLLRSKKALKKILESEDLFR